MAIVLGLSATGPWALPATAFAGAMATILLVYGLARTSRTPRLSRRSSYRALL